MQRREYLRLLGVGGIALPLAGCTEEGTEEAEGTVDAEDSDENGSGSDSGSGDGGDSSGSGLEIVEHQFYEDQFQAGVEGIVANNTGDALDYVEVKV